MSLTLTVLNQEILEDETLKVAVANLEDMS